MCTIVVNNVRYCRANLARLA